MPLVIFRDLSSICILSVLGRCIVLKVIWIFVLYICILDSLSRCCIYMFCGFHRGLLCNDITSFSTPHASAWWAPLNRFYAGLAEVAKTCIGPILRVLQTVSSLGVLVFPRLAIVASRKGPNEPLASSTVEVTS